MANQRRVGPELEKEVARLHQEGHAVSVIARTLGVPPKTLSSTIKRMGLEVTRHGRRSGITEEQIQQMVVSYQQGLGTKEIAAEHGVNDVTVARYLRLAGVELRPAGFQQGQGHHDWKGGRVPTSGGYMLVLVRPDDPFYPMAQIKSAGTEGARYCLEHRLVMARHLGRLLTDEETVHHKDDRDRQNNDISNLQLRRGNHGKGAALRCVNCGSCNITSEELQ
jgi:transposase-like protein